ncbi:MAG: hypothetical protein JWM09_914 [Francisellaceae bacterium]|nr:hypothetical protein [Francisellaceae bacterium]
MAARSTRLGFAFLPRSAGHIYFGYAKFNDIHFGNIDSDYEFIDYARALLKCFKVIAVEEFRSKADLEKLKNLSKNTRAKNIGIKEILAAWGAEKSAQAIDAARFPENYVKNISFHVTRMCLLDPQGNRLSNLYNIWIKKFSAESTVSTCTKKSKYLEVR